jgi:hypothetical protein
VYAAGLLNTIGCLEGHSVEPVEVAAMREVCRVGGWEIPSEFSLNPLNSPAVLMHWRALIELLGLMPAPKRDALCSLRFPLAREFREPSSCKPKVDRPEEPMDWTPGRMTSGGSVRRVLGGGRAVTPRASATRACGFSAPQPVPLFSMTPVPFPRLAGIGRGTPQSMARGVGKRTAESEKSLRSWCRMRWIPICIWTGHSGGFDWTPEPGSRNSWRSIRHPLLGSRSTWWGVLVFCDPKTRPKDPEKLRLPEGWVAAVGVHPENAGDFGDYYFDRLSRLIDSPAVTALGEVGLDCSEGAKPFAVRYSTLRWVLALARPYMPPACTGLGGRPPGNGCIVPEGIGVVQEKVPNSLQGIHLHCFHGDSVTVKR